MRLMNSSGWLPDTAAAVSEMEILLCAVCEADEIKCLMPDTAVAEMEILLCVRLMNSSD